MQIDNNGIIHLSNQQAECKISLWGGHILSYLPRGEKHDVFWMGNLNKFDNIQAIRGGVPVCWPRFAAEELNNHLPRHGFARLSNWSLQNISTGKDKSEAELLLIPDAKYNLNLSAKLKITITDKLECSLETTNHGNDEFKFSEALHAYFNIGNRDQTIIKGLSGQQYRSSLDGQTYRLEKDLTICDEFDAAFRHTGNIEIIDTVLNRVITLSKKGSNSTIVWNPNKDLAEMSQGQYKNFICIEPANQGAEFITLRPKEKHTISMKIGINKG